jgi:Phage integrase, N-terminal SAM-like domain
LHLRRPSERRAVLRYHPCSLSSRVPGRDHGEWTERVADWLTEVELASAQVGDETTRTYGRVLRLFREWCRDKGKDRKGMWGLTRPDVVAFVNRPRKTASGKASPNTIKLELVVLRRFYAWSALNYQTPNPLETMRALTRFDQPQAKPLDPRHVELALRNCHVAGRLGWIGVVQDYAVQAHGFLVRPRRTSTFHLHRWAGRVHDGGHRSRWRLSRGWAGQRLRPPPRRVVEPRAPTRRPAPAAAAAEPADGCPAPP